jgi:hypothetical protein
VAAEDAARGFNLDLQDGGILGAADRGEGAAAALAAALRAGDRTLLEDGGEVRLITAARPRLARLLATSPAG